MRMGKLIFEWTCRADYQTSDLDLDTENSMFLRMECQESLRVQIFAEE